MKNNKLTLNYRQDLAARNLMYLPKKLIRLYEVLTMIKEFNR